jgi:hypothetical protein
MSLLRPTTDKILHSLQLVLTATFESAGVMEDIAVMMRENKFILNVMLPTLHKRDPQISNGSDQQK